jgi:hypothetical protein
MKRALFKVDQDGGSLLADKGIIETVAIIPRAIRDPKVTCNLDENNVPYLISSFYPLFTIFLLLVRVNHLANRSPIATDGILV